jgi:hypothetical protein
MSNHKTININPDLFKIPNGGRSSRKRKSKDDDGGTPKIKFKSQGDSKTSGGGGRNKTTKHAILKFIRENQEKNYKKLMDTNANADDRIRNKSPTSVVDKFNGDFEESVKFFENVNKDLIEKQATQANKNHTLKNQKYVLDDFLNKRDVDDSGFSITDLHPSKHSKKGLNPAFDLEILTEIPAVFDLPPANLENISYSIGGSPATCLTTGSATATATTTTKNYSKPLYYKQQSQDRGQPTQSHPSWGCLKGGNLPTYKQFRQTQKIYPSPIATAYGGTSDPAIIGVDTTVSRPEFVISNIKGGFRLPERKLPKHAIEKQDAVKKQKNKLRYPKQKKTIRRQFQIGKSNIHPKVGVLISNRTIRKHISTQSTMLKQTPIQDVKKYLIRQGFIRIGSSAPNDVLRQMYESAKLMCGEIYNHNPDTLLYNFFNDTEANKPM